MFGCGIGNPYQSRLQSFRVGGCNAVSNRFTSAQKQNIKKKKKKKKKEKKGGPTSSKAYHYNPNPQEHPGSGHLPVGKE